MLVFLAGVWASFENEKTNKILGILGTIGIVVSEIYLCVDKIVKE